MPEPERDWKAELRARRFGRPKPSPDRQARISLLMQMLEIPLLSKRTRRMIQAQLDEERREKDR